MYALVIEILFTETFHKNYHVQVLSLLKALEQSAKVGSNLMPHILSSVEAYATLGEIADVMRGVFGLYEG